MEKKFQEIRNICSHCHGAQYVFAQWIEWMLIDRVIRLTSIPPDILKMIPAQHFIYCHCNPRVVLLNRRFTVCAECDGTTWKFSELAEHKGYFGKKIRKVFWQKIVQLPSRYFERCDCDKKPKSRDERKFVETLLECVNGTALL